MPIVIHDLPSIKSGCFGERAGTELVHTFIERHVGCAM